MLSRATNQLFRGSMRSNALFSKSLPQRHASLLMNSQFLNEDQTMIQQMAYDFTAAELTPFAAEWDKTKHFPKD